MKRMTNLIAVVAVLAAITGCKKKESTPTTGSAGSAATGSSGTGSAAEPVGTRPSQLPQTPLEKLVLPDDPKRKEKVELGHALFFDKRLSGANDRSCYSCHQNEDGLGGHDPLAIGSGDKKLTRHSPVLWNVGYWKGAFYWDGRAKTLEDNVKGAWGGGNMGAGPAPAGTPPTPPAPEKVTEALDKKAAELAKIPGYKKLFDAAFPGTPVKAEQVQSALAEYMRTIVCADTAFDKYAAGDKSALTEQQQRGLDLFLSPAKGNCIMCHAPPTFSTAMMIDGGAFFNVGIGTKDVPEDKVDVGRMKVTNNPADWAAFKVPSLRNVTKSPPYFHDGSVAKLEDAVKLMASGGIPNKNKFPQLDDRKLSDAELADLIAFLGALECPGKLEEPKLP
ncbi:MAG TPA: cytochrome c peroxidase [Kofleriaceae bacterium]|nr:cytochrome c peroxidase [Kofleriaceae bacterium]